MRLFLIDDQTMFRQGLKALIERTSPFLISGESRAADQAVTSIRDFGADLIILDSSFKNSLLNTITTLKELFPQVLLLVVSRHIDSLTVRQSLSNGADGYLPKSADSNELFRALTLVESGRCFIHTDLLACVVDEFRSIHRKPALEQTLTPKERELIEMVSEGLSNREISERLFVSVSTVKNYLRVLFKKFKVSDRTRLIVEAMNLGILNSLSHRRESHVS